jgi:hypothetical protein
MTDRNKRADKQTKKQTKVFVIYSRKDCRRRKKMKV